VRWAGVETEQDGALDALVKTAGGAEDRFVPHVTVLRRRARPGPHADPDPRPGWADHRGPWWSPPDVLLVSSEPGRTGPRYRVVHRVPLAGG
jgi:2'-5' RNA ligase